MKKIVLALSFLGCLGVVAVGCGGPDNVGACKDYVATVNGLECMSDAFKVADTFCDGYKDVSCDVATYFDCLQSHYACTDDGMLDATELAKTSECEVPTCN